MFRLASLGIVAFALCSQLSFATTLPIDARKLNPVYSPSSAAVEIKKQKTVEASIPEEKPLTAEEIHRIAKRRSVLSSIFAFAFRYSLYQIPAGSFAAMGLFAGSIESSHMYFIPAAAFGVVSVTFAPFEGIEAAYRAAFKTYWKTRSRLENKLACSQLLKNIQAPRHK